MVLFKHNYTALQGKIKDMYGTNEAFAKQIDLSPNTLINYFGNKTSIPSDNIEIIRRALNIKDYEISKYFFDSDVPQMKG